MRQKREKYLSRLAAILLALACAFALVSLLFMQLFKSSPETFFPAYRELSQGWLGLVSAAMSISSVAVWDIALVVFVISALAVLVFRVRSLRAFITWVSALLFSLAFTFALFVGGWALNHYAPPLADELGLELAAYSVDDLEQATRFYLKESATFAVRVERTDQASLQEYDFFELAQLAGSAYEPISERWPVFSGSTLPVKALALIGEPFLYSGYIGIFWAPTAEASVPFNCAKEELPFAMCHEAAHRLAIASEDEANFAAYLACTNSSDERFIYAGNFSAFNYCFNALYKESPERAQKLIDELMQSSYAQGVALVFSDRRSMRAHYERYKGNFEAVGNAVNNNYLKSFGEEAGVKSYRLVVDYLLAWYLSLEL